MKFRSCHVCSNYEGDSWKGFLQHLNIRNTCSILNRSSLDHQSIGIRFLKDYKHFETFVNEMFV